ncbi:HAD-superfamily hydrolase, subfamily IA, variant 1 family protein [Pseudooceanicola batsensis HTCC2597]|uniref:phosphoglycolate phosphatase n=1 Tax=Pseudooceanicola batsensis (strain ATCC BAA-863 / DSM 15984 / KCTC 12145 / HTCC2597) TaxID=252305 RepID=A3U1Z5_PSEBH|nr:HAD family hydrolase [Pseudooceanicola batsensis]EAQ01929.1 HAD-superfamily hydrolase, subfamily IA, variant 1 family protein [Pseudooceanicola batsensis HTCC2597]
MRIDGIIFDKDGTLFDFGATWNPWALELILELSEGDRALAERLAEAADFDLASGGFRPTSPIIAGTNREAAERLASVLPGRPVDELEELLAAKAAQAPLKPPVDLAPLLDGLRADGLHLGLMTNDSEPTARAHLDAAGILDRFDYVAGFDSGHGAKPAPTPLLAFAQQQGLAPARVAMVGDSTHDLIAGRAAGMRTVAVLTGMAVHDDLTAFADVVLPHIGHLADWLATPEDDEL